MTAISIHDPTKEGSVVALRDRMLADPKIVAYLDKLKRKRIALVLSGGGGKGAYEAGVLLALFDAGLRKFCALSGTSVGALNAGLCHELCRTERREIVLEVWGELSWRRVLRINPGRLLLALFARILLIPGLAVGFVENRLQRAMRRAEFSIRFKGLTFFRYLVYHTLDQIGRFFLFGICATMAVLMRDAGVSVVLGTCALLAVAIGLLSGPLLARFLAFTSNAPLRDAILRTVDADALRQSSIPVFATMTCAMRAWDDSWSALGESKDVTAPAYAELCKMKSAEAVRKCLVFSAALPDVFPAGTFFGLPFIDGGLVDNTPILPVALIKPDMLIVVYLDSRANSVGDLWLHEQARTFWLMDLVYRICLHEEGTIQERADYAQMRDKMLADAWAIRLFGRQQFLPIVPSRWLGNLVRGTLNFRKSKADSLIQLGYCDTLNRIKDFADSDPEAPAEMSSKCDSAS